MNPFALAAKKLLQEPAITLGIVAAAINSTPVGDQNWKGYAVAVGVALLRQVVSPVYGKN